MPKRKSDYVIFNVSTKRLRTVSNELISPLRNGTVSNAQKAKLRKLVTRPKGALDIELAKVLGWKSLSNALAFAREAFFRSKISPGCGATPPSESSASQALIRIPRAALALGPGRTPSFAGAFLRSGGGRIGPGQFGCFGAFWWPVPWSGWHGLPHAKVNDVPFGVYTHVNDHFDLNASGRPSDGRSASELVAVGNFNPLILRPDWLRDKELIVGSDSDELQIEVLHAELVMLRFPWGRLQSTGDAK